MSTYNPDNPLIVQSDNTVLLDLEALLASGRFTVSDEL